MHTGRSWLCPPAAALTVARNWASSSGKLAVYSSFTMHMYSETPRDITRPYRNTRVTGDTRERTPCRKTLMDSYSKLKTRTIKN